jgi:hypothetical protein
MQAQNMQNVGPNRTNSSGFRGVTWDRNRGKWSARIKISGRQLNLGVFVTREAAFHAFLTAKAERHPFQSTPRDMNEAEAFQEAVWWFANSRWRLAA